VFLLQLSTEKMYTTSKLVCSTADWFHFALDVLIFYQWVVKHTVKVFPLLSEFDKQTV